MQIVTFNMLLDTRPVVAEYITAVRECLKYSKELLKTSSFNFLNQASCCCLEISK